MIRRFKKQDKEIFLKFTTDFYASDAVDHNIPQTFHEDAWNEMLKGDTYMWGYMIESGQQPAGYAMLSKTYSHEGGGMVWWIEELYIAPEYRGKGLGRSFFEFIQTELDESVTRLRLEVELDNEGAVRLYKRYGFEVLEYGQMVKQIRN